MQKRIRSLFLMYRGLPHEIYILFASRVVNCLGSFIFPLLTLILTQKLGMSKTETGTFIALLTATQGPCLFLGGKLTDSVGRKKTLVASQLLGSIGYLLCGLTANRHALTVLIVLAADLFVVASPAYQALFADLTNKENRRESFSLLYLGINIGMAISPILGGLLFQDHLRLLFLLDAATTLASSLLIALFVREVPLSEREEEPDTGAPGAQGSVFRVLWAAPVLALFILFLFFYYFTYSQWGFLLPLQLGDLYGAGSARFYGMLNTLNAALVVFCTPVITRLTARFRPLRVLAGGGLLYVAAFAAFAVFRSTVLFVLTSAVFTAAEIMTTIYMGTFLADHAPNAYLGRINSIATFFQGGANALAPMAMGFVLAAAGYFRSWLLIAALMLLGAAGMLWLNRFEGRQAARARGAALREP